MLHTTQHHPFWDATSGTWVNATDLTVGHDLRTLDGAIVTVTAVNNRVDSKAMRDLTVDDIHTYYVVAGTTPVLVHNCGGGEWADPNDINFSQRTVSQMTMLIR